MSSNTHHSACALSTQYVHSACALSMLTLQLNKLCCKAQLQACEPNAAFNSQPRGRHGQADHDLLPYVERPGTESAEAVLRHMNEDTWALQLSRSACTFGPIFTCRFWGDWVELSGCNCKIPLTGQLAQQICIVLSIAVGAIHHHDPRQIRINTCSNGRPWPEADFNARVA